MALEVVARPPERRVVEDQLLEPLAQLEAHARVVGVHAVARDELRAEPRLTSFCISSIWSIIFWLFARSRRSCFSSSATASAMSSLGGGGGEVGGGGDGGGDRGT